MDNFGLGSTDPLEFHRKHDDSVTIQKSRRRAHEPIVSMAFLALLYASDGAKAGGNTWRKLHIAEIWFVR